MSRILRPVLLLAAVVVPAALNVTVVLDGGAKTICVDDYVRNARLGHGGGRPAVFDNEAHSSTDAAIQ